MAAVAAILALWSKWFQLFLIYKWFWYFLPSFQSINLSVQEKKRWQSWQPFWISDGTSLAICDLKVALILPTKFQVDEPFGSGEAFQNRFPRWRPFWISNLKYFGYFWSTSPLNTSKKRFKSVGLSTEGKNPAVAATLGFWLKWF